MIFPISEMEISPVEVVMRCIYQKIDMVVYEPWEEASQLSLVNGEVGTRKW